MHTKHSSYYSLSRKIGENLVQKLLHEYYNYFGHEIMNNMNHIPTSCKLLLSFFEIF